MRTLFRALKREQVIFDDPTRAVKVSRARAIPLPLASERLLGLLDQIPTPLGKMTIALIAIHALARVEVLHLQREDLDLAAGRLVVHRGHQGTHTVVLDELTMRLILEWLRERDRLWPLSVNPHLLVNRQSAIPPNTGPVSPASLAPLFRLIKINATRLRTDRILDEAQHTADPVHLMRVFGLSADTAMRYSIAAHPDKFRLDPIRP